MLVAIRLTNNISNNCASNGGKIKKESYTLTYNNRIYYVMPEDIIEENIEYKRILEQFNISKNIKKENVGTCILNTKNSILYRIKDVKTKDVLILKDNMGEYVYAFSEKLFR